MFKESLEADVGTVFIYYFENKKKKKMLVIAVSGFEKKRQTMTRRNVYQ
jgi:hypothetical protein